MKLGALSALVDGTGNPVSTATTIALRDFQNATGTLNFLGGVTYSTVPPVHKTFLNALFFDWHVGPVKISTMAPQ
jgi:prepilin-type processing-associated H-X9-DG protein